MSSPTQETPVREFSIGVKNSGPHKRGRPAVYADQAAKSRAQREREALLRKQAALFLDAFIHACDAGGAHPFIDHLPENLGERLEELAEGLIGKKLVVCNRERRKKSKQAAPGNPGPPSTASVSPARREVLAWHAEHGPATDNDCIRAWQQAGRNTNGIRARRGELVRARLMQACGRQGGSTLWEATELGRAALEVGE
jgi:hypothetical protein